MCRLVPAVCMVYVLLRAIAMLVITTLLYLAECVCSWEICKMNMSDGYCGHFAFYGIILAIFATVDRQTGYQLPISG